MVDLRYKCLSLPGHILSSKMQHCSDPARFQDDYAWANMYSAHRGTTKRKFLRVNQAGIKPADGRSVDIWGGTSIRNQCRISIGQQEKSLGHASSEAHYPPHIRAQRFTTCTVIPSRADFFVFRSHNQRDWPTCTPSSSARGSNDTLIARSS